MKSERTNYKFGKQKPCVTVRLRSTINIAVICAACIPSENPTAPNQTAKKGTSVSSNQENILTTPQLTVGDRCYYATSLLLIRSHSSSPLILLPIVHLSYHGRVPWTRHRWTALLLDRTIMMSYMSCMAMKRFFFLLDFISNIIYFFFSFCHVSTM